MVEYFRNVDSVFFFYVIIISVICAYLCQTCERIFAFSFCFHHSLAVFSLLRRNRIWIYPGELILHIFDENQALKWNLWDLFAHCFHVCWLFSSFKVPGWREDWHKIVGEMFVESGVCVCVCACVLIWEALSSAGSWWGRRRSRALVPLISAIFYLVKIAPNPKRSSYNAAR